jgi:murein DD-endopeptidase MepM/ murein hydrolase activator NlpD
MRFAMSAVACLLLARPAAAQATRLTIAPARPEPGALVRLTLRDSSSRGAIVAIRGQMAGEPLHFPAASGRTFRAVGAIPMNANGPVAARVVVERRGATDTITATVVVPRVRMATSRLEVDTGFTKPLDTLTEARIARDNARARDVGRRAHETPTLWTARFVQPRASVITSRFGTGRVFNGAVTSRHLGVDFRGDVGDTIRAANRGVVALVDTFFLAGNVVYLDHGGGIVTGYFHMSKPLVAVGDTVKRGQPIGLVGNTGRVTGPHLHWSARYGLLTVNPLDLIRVLK